MVKRGHSAEKAQQAPQARQSKRAAGDVEAPASGAMGSGGPKADTVDSGYFRVLRAA